MRILPTIAVAVAALAAPRPSQACSCRGGHVVVTPSDKVAAPRNVQVRISFSVYRPEVDEATLALVTTSGTAIAVDKRAFTQGSMRVVVLAPDKPLDAKTTYRVIGKTKADPRARLGEITTGAFTDAKPPTWKGIGLRRALVRVAQCCLCNSGEPFQALDIIDGAPKDDRTPSDDVWFAVWPAAGKLELASAIAIVPWWAGRITLGHPTVCGLNNFDLPDAGQRLDVRIAPIDLAGNIGEPADATLDLTNPTQDAD
jgi:hypothetical protein